MDSLARSDIFFVIATIGFCILAVLMAIALVYLILIFRRWYRMSRKIESDVESISEEVKQFFQTLMESKVVSWIVGKKQKKK